MSRQAFCLVMAALTGLALTAVAQAERIDVAGADSSAINAAIDRSKPGDTVFLPAGTYSISQSIRPKSETRLEGAGQDAAIVHYAGEAPSFLIDLSERENVEVCNLALDGQMNLNVTQGIYATNARQLNLHHITVRNLGKADTFGPHGIHLTGQGRSGEGGVTDSVVADCHIENIGIGANFGGGMRLSRGSSRNRVLRNTIVDTGRGGILTDNGSSDLIIQGNSVNGSGGEGLGIEIWGGCHRSVIEDNRIDHWLSVSGCDFVAVRRNLISDKSGEYKFCAIESIGSYHVFSDNTVDGGSSIGLSVSDDSKKGYVFWAKNTVRDCNQWGAQFQGEEAAAIVGHYLYNCTFDNTTVGQGSVLYPGDEGHGFRTNGYCHFTTFENCTFINSGRYGLQLRGGNVDGLTFIGCTIKNNKGAAVTGLEQYTALEWVDCVVEGNADNTLPPAKPFPAAVPAASFEMPQTARVGEAVTFRDTSTAAEGVIKTVLWDFGAGIPANTPQAEHTYEKPGEYRVTLIDWNEAGRGSRAERTLTITN